MNSYTSKSLPEIDLCVLIPCYNNQEGLIKSLQSIVYKPEKLWVLIVDDGSLMPVQEEAIASTGISFRFHVIRLYKNEGITHALNTGLQWIEDHLQTRFVARLDCGDLCHQERFFKQVKFLDENTQVGLLGSWCEFHNPQTGLKYAYTTPLEHASILSEMHFRNVFIHPTVVFRSELIKETGKYPIEYPYVEDYALFFKMLHKTKGAILNDFLVTCELNPKGISLSNRKEQLFGRRSVVSDYGVFAFKKIAGEFKLLFLSFLPYGLVHLVKSKLS
ncbi:glycosyltransferase [Rufibacter sediminis]|uniref:Glycosyltransferase n=1 Tax=Rufibacter sediminis TaxID=2762756 RepID=A0ABR6VNE5_9BACT|nr:glycosyltransferase [Rufibacter sediminis]MBC3538714.1 glycosyltransferase [Rufibacter sediminis]